MSAPREDRPVLGYLLAGLAFFAFSFVDFGAKLMVEAAYPVLMVAFARYASNFVLVLIYFVSREGRSALISNAKGVQTLRGLALLTSTVLNFWALSYLPLTITIPIFFLVPLITCLLSVPLLGEHVGLRRYLAILVGFIGVLIIIRPGGIEFHWAMLISIGASTTASLYFIFTRMIAGRDDTPVSQIYAAGIATLCLLPFIGTFWQTPASTSHWLILIALGAIAGFGHTVLTIAARFQEAAKLVPLVYTEIIYITILSWVFFSELPDRWTVLGTLVIIGSGTYVWMRERRVRRHARSTQVGRP